MLLQIDGTLIADTPIEVLMTLFTNPKIGIIHVSSRWTKTRKPGVDHIIVDSVITYQFSRPEPLASPQLVERVTFLTLGPQVDSHKRYCFQPKHSYNSENPLILKTLIQTVNDAPTLIKFLIFICGGF